MKNDSQPYLVVLWRANPMLAREVQCLQSSSGGSQRREIPRSKAEISGSNHFLNTQMNGLYLLLLQYHIYARHWLYCRGHERGVCWVPRGFFLLLSSINAWSWRKWCHFWCEWVHEGTNWPLPSFPVCPLFFLKLRWCSLFRNISLKADMPRGRAGPNNFERRAEKMQWIFRQMTICYWFLVPAAPSLGLSIFRGHGGLIFGSSANSFKKRRPPLFLKKKRDRGGQEKGCVPGMEK